LQYGNDRTQFGRSIGKFQAVQHQLAVMAEHVA
ncbi:acyl-CoA dehydrogenase family protein, partial [Bordetella pertussis]